MLSHLVIIEQKYLPGSPIVPDLFKFGAAGVDLFFVISGFIITMITRGSFEQPGETSRFLARRVVRIYPIYWFYCLLLLAVFLVNPAMVNSSYGRPDLLKSFLLIPDVEPMLLAVAWTLSFEMFFYLVFAVALWGLTERQTKLAILLWIPVTIAGALLLQPTAKDPFLTVIFSPLILEFIVGSLVASYASRLTERGGAVCLCIGVLWILGGMSLLYVTGMTSQGDWAWVAVFGGGSALLLAGFVNLEDRMKWRHRGWLVLLGDASYSLYLAHVLTLSAVGRVWQYLFAGPSALNHLAALGIAVFLTIAWAIVSYRLIEMPILKSLRVLTDRPKRLAPIKDPGAA
jgi:exopolysaccharide production protein ExoZ